MQLWHLTLASKTRHALFPSEAERLRAVFTVTRICGTCLVLFCVADDHIHVVLLCDDWRRAYLARGLKLAVAGLTSVETKPVHFEPINGRSHMETVRRYVLRQPEHHQLPGHPALWSGSCFLDLVGARWIPDLTLRIQDVLPRCTFADVCRDIDLPLRRLEPVPLADLRAVGPRALVVAAAEACGAPPELNGKRRECVRARRIACSLTRDAGMPLKETAWALDIHPGNARKLLVKPAEPEALLATRTRLALEREVARDLERRRQREASAGQEGGRWRRNRR